MKTLHLSFRFPQIFPALLAASFFSVFASLAQAQKAPAAELTLTVPIDLPDLVAKLSEAPKENDAEAKSKPLAIALPMPDGSDRQFIVEENDVVSGEFAQQFPELKTYSMWATDDPAVFGRLTVSPFGVRSTVFAKEGWIDIAPVDVNAPVMHKIQLLKGGGKDFMCGVSDEMVSVDLQKSMMMPTTPWSNGATKRNFRMAIVATFHYYEANGSSVGATQAALAAVVNNLSAIYERELAMTFSISPPPFIYTNTNAPYPFFAFPESERTVRSGKAVGEKFPDPTKYDVGHVFHGGTYNIQNWGGGGACTSCLCDDTPTPNYAPGLRKGEGFSMLVGNDPPQELTILAHEIGHMFGMPHTWAGYCSPSGNQIGDAYEIGSGTTILSYNNVCSQQNSNIGGGFPVANNYFHHASLDRAVTYISNKPTCGVTTPSGNTPPVVDATPSPCNAVYTVPKGTPFKLTGSGTDANDDPIYYCWEQFDLATTNTQGKLGAQAASIATAPLFRSYPPTTDPSRTFPNMTLVAANNYASNFEPLPTVARTLKFRLTGRDFRAGAGGIHYDTVNVTVSNLGPLTVTAPNTATTIAAGSNTTVTWNGNGINFLTNVRIKLSVDGGLTFPYILAASTPNDGSQSVAIPAIVPGTTAAKIMVESADYTCFSFFDVSNVNFTITNAGCTPAAHNLCNTSPVTAASGNAALDLNSPTVIYGQPATSISMTTSGSAQTAMNQAAPIGNSTSCTALNLNRAFSSKKFMVDNAGVYRFGGPGFSNEIFSVYTTPFTSGTPCANFIGSNAHSAPGGGYGFGYPLEMNLNACTEYEIVLWTGSATTKTIEVTPVSGGNFYLGSTPPAGYTQTYIVVNPVTGNIVALSATANFTSLGEGSFLMYGAHYVNSANPGTWVGQPFSTVLATNCVTFSNNSKPLTVTPGSNMPPSLAISGGGSTNEGNCINATFTFTVARSGNLASQSTANWAVTGSGANAANAADFVGGALPSGTVTFPAGSSSQTIVVIANADATVEPNEGFTVTLSAPANATIGTATATGTILNDDPFTSECSGSYCTPAHTGGTCGAADQFISKVVFAGIDQSSTCANSLPAGYANYTCTGGAVVSKGCGYSLQVTIGNPKTGDSVRAYFDWNNDGDFDDANEEFTLTGSGANFTRNITVPGTAAIGSTRMRVRLFATGVSPAPCGSVAKGEAEDYCISVGATGVSISSTAASKDEGNSGTTAFTFSVSRSCPSTVVTTLNWQVSGSGTNPAAAADFSGGTFPGGSITFPAGSTAPQTITVNVNGDTNGEPDEQFTVTLSPQDNASIDIGSATGTIKNDDGINVSITGSPSQNEGNSGTTAFLFTVNRSGFNANPTTVNWAVTGSGANAASASDFTGGVFPSGTVTFPANQNVLAQTITVNVLGDANPEQNESFTVTLSGAANGTITTATASGTILNDDAGTAPAIAISGSPSLNEGNAGNTAFTFTVNRTGSTTNASTASWAVTGSGTNPANATDFAGAAFPSGTVTFPAGSSAAQTITVNVNGDLTNEQDETFTVTLSNPGNATITTATATGTIVNDDGYCAAGTVGGNTFENISDVVFNTINNHSTGQAGYQNFTNVSTTVTQGATYPFTATIAGGGADEQIIVWIDYNQDFDFNDPGETVFTSSIGTGPFSSNITIPANAMTGTTRMRVRLNDTGNPPTNATPCGNSTLGQVEDYTINIIASVPSLAISGSPALAEGNSGAKNFNFTVTRTGNLTSASSASVAVTGSGGNPATAADFTGGVFLNGMVNFPAGSATQTVVVNVNGDLTVEPDEGFTVTLSSPTNATITTATATGTIQNDDVAGVPDIAIQAGPSLNEGNAGSTAFNFTVVRTGSTTNQTTVDWNVVPVNVPHSANAGDFTGGVWQSGTVTFPAGSAANQTITVNVAGDTEIEVVELFNVDLSNAVNGNITAAFQTATINNDDTPGSGCSSAYVQTFVYQGCQTTGQFISNVTFNTINNSSTCANSGNAGYTNYTGISTSVNRSASYPITVTHGGSNTGLAEATVWFDWNADGDFADAGEEFELTPGTFPNWTGSIAVPVGAALGSTRMRVRLSGYGTPVATGFQDASEAEDYCITVLAACTAPTVNAPTVTQPTCSVATGSIVVNTGAGTFDYSINNGTTWQASATFSNLPPGNYNIKVRQQASPICTTAYASNPVVLAAAAGCGTALDFRNASGVDYVNCGNILTSCYTKELWVNMSPTNGITNNFISGSPAAPHAFYAPSSTGYKVSSGHNGNFTVVQEPVAITAGWHHYAVTYDATTQIMRLYREGVLVDEAFNVPAATGTNQVYLGSFDTNNGFDGVMDEVRIWNYARSEADILADKDSKLTGKEPGLVAYYDFEQGAPNGSNAGLTTLYDKALPANNGTLTNFALTGTTSNWTQPGAPVTSDGTNFAIQYSVDLPKTISATGTPTVISTMEFPYAGTITDIEFYNLNIDHTYIQDLRIKLKSPAGTERILLNSICGSQDNILLSLDDESPNTYASIPCPPNGGDYQPFQTLAAFDGENAQGTWTLTIEDLANQDGGTLQNWGLGIDYVTCALPVVTAPTVTQTSCSVSTGTIVVNAACSGTLEYSVNNGATWQASATFANLPPGSYNIKVRLNDSKFCEAAYPSNPVLIEALPVPPTIEAVTVTQATCTTPTGTIVVTATTPPVPSTPPAALEYSSDNGSTWQTSNTFSGLAAGNYNIRVRLQASPGCSTIHAANPVVLTAAINCTPGRSLDFDGANNHVSLPANLTASLTNFTFEAWVFWDGSSNWQRIIDFGNNTSTYMFLTPSSGANSKPQFSINNGGGQQDIASSVAATQGQWQHYAVVIDDAANTGVLYLDGAQVGSNTNMTLTPTTLGNLANNYLGRSQFPSDPYFNGKIDDVRIWNIAKTSQQVQCEMDATLVGNEVGLVAYYNFDQGFADGSNSGQDALYDLTSNGQDGMLKNFALSGSGSNWTAETGSGKVLAFDGVNDYVNLMAIDFYDGDFTVEGWINAGGSSDRAIFSCQNASDLTVTYVGITSGNLLRFFYRNPPGSSGGIDISSPGTVTGDWRHFAAVYGTDNKLRMYIDGVLVNTSAGTIAPVANGTASKFHIGLNIISNPRYFNGKMDEFRVWNFAKTQDQIRAQKDVPLAGSETGLVAYYNFNQGAADGTNTGLTTLDDRSASNANGTLTGFALTGNSSNWSGPGPLTDAPGLGCCPTNWHVNGIITSGTYHATTDLTSDGTIPAGANVTFKAATSILLQPNFTETLGAIFTTVMQACTP